MALVVGNDSYVTLTEANTYWSDRNNSTWSAADDADKEKAIREATQYLDTAYDYIGTHSGVKTDLLAWPRYSAEVIQGNLVGVFYDSDEIPPQIKQASYELALDALSARLRPIQERGGNIKREKVDVLEVEYSDFAPSQKTFDFVTLLLTPLLKSKGNSAKLVRV